MILPPRANTGIRSSGAAEVMNCPPAWRSPVSQSNPRSLRQIDVASRLPRLDHGRDEQRVAEQVSVVGLTRVPVV